MPKNLILFLFFLLFMSVNTQATFLVEPYAGYVVSGSGEATSSGTKVDYSHSGAAFGARAGLKYLGVMGGVDYSMRSEFDLEAETTLLGTAISVKDKHEGKTMGVFVGYELPMMLRFWGSYLMDVTWEDTDGSDVGDELSGSGYGLGIGFTALPLMSINLEYKMFEFDESKDASAGTTASIASPLEMNEILLSVSIPFDF